MVKTVCSSPGVAMACFFVGGVGVGVTLASFAESSVRTPANLAKASGTHVRWQNACRRGGRRRLSRGPVARGAVSASLRLLMEPKELLGHFLIVVYRSVVPDRLTIC